MMSPFFWKACGSFPQSIDKHFVLRRIIKQHVPRRAAGACLVCSKTDGNRFPLWSGSPYAAKTDIGKATNGTQYGISLQPENGPRSQKPERKVG